MKTPEQILENYPLTDCDVSFFATDEIIKAMHEYADQFKPKWINVEDQLPPCGNYFLTFAEKQDINMRYLSLTHGQLSKIDFLKNINFTHWMPLPEKPSQQDFDLSKLSINDLRSLNMAPPSSSTFWDQFRNINLPEKP